MHSIECTRSNIASAIYYLTDMIVFEVYNSLSDNEQYLCMTITKDDETVVYTDIYEWQNVPTYVMDIYEYVANTSKLVPDCSQPGCYKLYGNHIGRCKDYQMHLASFASDPIDQNALHILPIAYASASENNDAFIKDIRDTMTTVKKLVV
jgi:hypothetical protein